VLRKITVVAALLVLAACADDERGGTAPRSPASIAFSVTANANNALSAIASLDVSDADSAHVVYWTASAAKQSTPFAKGATASRTVVLGLHAATQYSMYFEAVRAGVVTLSDTVVFTTGALPDFLAASHLSSATMLHDGYVIAALQNSADAYLTVFDSTGEVAWYRALPGETLAETKQQANGDFTAVLTTSHGGEPVTGRAIELAPDGSIVRTFTAPASSPYFDDHEFWLLFDNGVYDGALFLAYNQRHLDLSSQGGPADSLVSGHQLIRQSADGAQRVVFDAWDHFRLSDNVEPTAGQADFDHPNAITFDTDGNYIVSWRNFDALTKINASTGALMWTLASPLSALASDFTIVGDPLDGFSAQHSARILDDGHLLLFDNGTSHATVESRAVEYRLDAGARTATMVFQFHHAPPVYTQFTGSVQRLQNGSTFIGWPWTPTVLASEVTASGSSAWEGSLVAPAVELPYRFTKIRSLYSYVKP
jgi:arylsulfate sulfotransferase